MATSQVNSDLQSAIDSFAADLTALIEQSVAEAMVQALNNVDTGKAPSRKGKRGASRSTSKVAPKRRAKGEKRGAAELAKLKDDLLREIKREGGRRIEQISEAMQISTKELKLPMLKLIDEKKVKTKGQKRATRYSAK